MLRATADRREDYAEFSADVTGLVVATYLVLVPLE